MLRNILSARKSTLPIYRALSSGRMYSQVATNEASQVVTNKEEPPILLDKYKNTRLITFNRPKQLNSTNIPSINIYYPALKTYEEFDNVDLILIKGKGRALSSGGDIKFFANAAIDPTKNHELAYFLDNAYGLFHQIGTMKKPIVTFMNGISMGYGLAMGTLPAFGVATENTKISMPETRFGHFCDVGSSFFLQHLNGHIGKYMALTAHIFQAEDTVLSGLASHFVPSDRLEDLEDKLKNLEKPSHDMVNNTIEKFAVKSDHTYSSKALCKENRAIINSCFKYDTVEEIIQALEKEGSKFSLDTIEQINKGSPIGVKLTAELHRRASGLSFLECLRLERFLWETSPFQPEFQMGIEGIVKKQTPDWTHPNVNAVDMEDDIIFKYFSANFKGHAMKFSTDRDHYKSHNSKYKLPSDDDILQARKSNDFKSYTDFTEWFVKEHKDKFGIREQVEDVINRVGFKNM